MDSDINHDQMKIIICQQYSFKVTVRKYSGNSHVLDILKYTIKDSRKHQSEINEHVPIKTRTEVFHFDNTTNKP